MKSEITAKLLSQAESISSESLLGTIYEKCIDIYEGVAAICITVKTDEFCARVTLLGIKLAEACAGYDTQGNVGRAAVDLVTVNTGIWKLEGNVIKVEQNFDNGNGRATFSGKLYQLTLTGYKKKKEWNDDTIASW